MDNLIEANEKLIDTVKSLVAKIKDLRNENENLRMQLNSSQSAMILTNEQKAEIEKLLVETKEVLENPLVGQTV